MMFIIAALFMSADPTLVVAGGGTTTDAIAKRAVELAGGAKANVVIVAWATERVASGESSATFWRTFGPARVDVAEAAKPDTARTLIAAADLIWMPGGDQNRLLDTLDRSRMSDVIRSRYQAGGVVGGTSAGAAVLSERCLTGEADDKGVKRGGTKTRAGLALWPGVTVDQHFLARNRFNRLLAATLDQPQCLGVGIDEATAVIVQSGTWQVVGNGQVIVIDARAAKSEPGALHAARGMTLHLLKPGETFKP